MSKIDWVVRGLKQGTGDSLPVPFAVTVQSMTATGAEHEARVQLEKDNALVYVHSVNTAVYDKLTAR